MLDILEKVLGKGKPTSRGNYSFHCPRCKHKKPKLEINLDPTSPFYQNYNCWVCNDNFNGKSIKSLFKKLKVHETIINQLPKKGNITYKLEDIKFEELSLPKEFISLISPKQDLLTKRALNYLKSRGVTYEDIIKYNIGYCNSGQFSDNIIIPSYDGEGKLNYFTTRSFEPNPFKKHNNPNTSRDIIPFEFFINWEQPIILTEGAFDMISIKRNCIPLLGKTITKKLMQKLVESKVKKIYLALDQDAIKKSIKYAEELMEKGKEIYIVELNGKDANDIGFEEFTKLVQKTQPLTFKDLITKKIEL